MTECLPMPLIPEIQIYSDPHPFCDFAFENLLRYVICSKLLILTADNSDTLNYFTVVIKVLRCSLLCLISIRCKDKKVQHGIFFISLAFLKIYQCSFTKFLTNTFVPLTVNPMRQTSCRVNS